ncbi:MAG TPA: hypothetical protein DD629_03170 [Treponema sp.]|nr:hypothetical protein [Treponema sp.]
MVRFQSRAFFLFACQKKIVKYTLPLLKEKILHDIDYNFLDTIKNKFPTNNPYSLVCLAEVIFNREEDDTYDILKEVIDEAYDLYKNANISEYLSGI